MVQILLQPETTHFCAWQSITSQHHIESPYQASVAEELESSRGKCPGVTYKNQVQTHAGQYHDRQSNVSDAGYLISYLC